MNAAQLERAREWRKINYYGKPCELMDECLAAFAASETAKLTELQADAFETQRQQIEALKSDLKVETAAKEAAEKPERDNWILSINLELSNLRDWANREAKRAEAAEAERDRAVRALESIANDPIIGMEVLDIAAIWYRSIAKAALSPVPVPAPTKEK